MNRGCRRTTRMTPTTFMAKRVTSMVPYPRALPNPRFVYAACLFSAALLVFPFVIGGQDAARLTDAPPAPAGGASADDLAFDQSRIADKYIKLEQLMLKMAELEGLTNPKRAQLLTRAVEQ